MNAYVYEASFVYASRLLPRLTINQRIIHSLSLLNVDEQPIKPH